MKISEIEALEVHNKIVKKFKQFSDNPEQMNMSQMWKIFKKMWPKNSGVLPVAKRNFKGKIVSSQNDLKNLLSREYKDRLRSRPMRPDLKYLKERRKKIFEMKMKIAKANHSSEWTMAQLDTALSNLKNNKSRDPNGYVNETFKDGIIGEDLKMSLLLMMNKLKLHQMVPLQMRLANITTIPKSGSRLELKMREVSSDALF